MKAFLITPAKAGLAQFEQSVVIAETEAQVRQIFRDHKEQWFADTYWKFPSHPQSRHGCKLYYYENQGELKIEEIDLTQIGFVTGDFNYE